MSSNSKGASDNKGFINDDRISPNYKMEMKEGYSSFQLLPDDEDVPDHKNHEMTKNDLLLILLSEQKEKQNFAKYVKNFKGTLHNPQKDTTTFNYLKKSQF